MTASGSSPDTELLRLLAIKDVRHYSTETLLELQEYSEREAAIAASLPDSDTGKQQLVIYHTFTLEAVQAELRRRERWEQAVRHPAGQRFDASFARDLKARVDLRLLVARDVELRKASRDRATG